MISRLVLHRKKPAASVIASSIIQSFEEVLPLGFGTKYGQTTSWRWNTNFDHFNNKKYIYAKRFFSNTYLVSQNVDQSTPLRRRRRRNKIGGGSSDDSSEFDSSATVAGGMSNSDLPLFAASEAFAPKDLKTGELLTSPEYLALASLSPWVPCPEMVIKRIFEIADASSSDVHVDLGCGDGRLNFAAVGNPWNVKKSWGVDIDHNVLDRCQERLKKRFVPRLNRPDSFRVEESSDQEKLEFLQSDLKKVIERQKKIFHESMEKEQNQQISHEGVVVDTIQTSDDWSKEDTITQKLSNSTIVTMYFVHDALEQLQPYLASVLGGKENVRVITVGYEMKGWEPSWAENVMGLTVFKYDMDSVPNDPIEWFSHGDDNADGNEKDSYDTNDADYDNVDLGDDSPLSNYLRQKREQDMEELKAGLTIHHDEQLDQFAAFRAKKNLSNESMLAMDDGEEWEDFDDTEDPQELINEVQRMRKEEMMEGSRKMFAGMDNDKKNKGSGVKHSAASHQVWKKP